MGVFDNEQNDYDVFISYSHKDIVEVERIINILKEKSDKKIWFDKNLRGGDNYFSVIAKQILQNEFFLFMVSKNSAFSDWCERELQFAASEKKKIIAIWLEDTDVPPGVKIVINNTHYINRYNIPKSILDEEIEKMFNFSELKYYTDYSEEDVNSLSTQELENIFFSKSDLRNLKNLVTAEKNGHYSLCFLPENANLLGMAYENGITVEKNLIKSSLYYKASLHQNNSDGKFLYALLHNNNEILSSALEAADNGSSIAMIWLGNAYFDGKKGVYTDREKAFSYYSNAARMGNILGMYFTAHEYRVGKRTQTDYELAYMYFLRSIEAGFPKAYRRLALMYEDGKYFPKDYKKALEMFELAVENGDYLSYYFMGNLYGDCLKQLDKRQEMYEKAVYYADQNLIKSGLPYYAFALQFFNIAESDETLDKSVDYHLKAAKKGYAPALRNTVAYIMLMNEAVRTDYLQKAFEFNCDSAAYELGNIEKKASEDFTDGLPEKAIWYYEKGAENGDILCIKELLKNYSLALSSKGTDWTARNRNNAIKWFNFLFSLDENHIEKKIGSTLYAYYYAYAVELDYDPFNNKPDKKLALYYFNKALSNEVGVFEQIVNLIEGFLFPEDSGSDINRDIGHAEELAELIDKYLLRYCSIEEDSDTDEYIGYEWQPSRRKLYKIYDFLYKCYHKGDIVEKNKEKTKYYKGKRNAINTALFLDMI